MYTYGEGKERGVERQREGERKTVRERVGGGESERWEGVERQREEERNTEREGWGREGEMGRGRETGGGREKDRERGIH